MKHPWADPKKMTLDQSPDVSMVKPIKPKQIEIKQESQELQFVEVLDEKLLGAQVVLEKMPAKSKNKRKKAPVKQVKPHAISMPADSTTSSPENTQDVPTDNALGLVVGEPVSLPSFNCIMCQEKFYEKPIYKTHLMANHKENVVLLLKHGDDVTKYMLHGLGLRLDDAQNLMEVPVEMDVLGVPSGSGVTQPTIGQDIMEVPIGSDDDECEELDYSDMKGLGGLEGNGGLSLADAITMGEDDDFVCIKCNAHFTDEHEIESHLLTHHN